MKRLSMRGFSTGLFLVYFFLSAVLISFSVFALAVFQDDSVPAEISNILSPITFAFLLLPGVMMLLSGLFSIWTKIEIYEDKIFFVRPFRKTQVLDHEQITFFGCVAYAPRSSMLFFCTEDPETVKEYLRTHWDQCIKIFGPNRVNELQNTEQGWFRLAVGTYLRHHIFHSFPTFLIFQYGSTKRLCQVVQALKRDAMLTGPCLIDDEPSWEKYAVYTDNQHS